MPPNLVGRPGGRPRAYGYGRAHSRGRYLQVSPERGRVKTSASYAPEQGKSRNRRFLADFWVLLFSDKSTPRRRRNSLKYSRIYQLRCSAPIRPRIKILCPQKKRLGPCRGPISIPETRAECKWTSKIFISGPNRLFLPAFPARQRHIALLFLQNQRTAPPQENSLCSYAFRCETRQSMLYWGQ